MAQVTLDELPDFAAEFVARLNPGDRVALIGPIGAGKTTFTRHLLVAMGLTDLEGFSSPTFTLHHRHDTPMLPVHHIDLYRLKSFAELQSADLLPYFADRDALTMVEWADRFPEARALCNRRVVFDYGADEHSRKIEIA